MRNDTGWTFFNETSDIISAIKYGEKYLKSRLEKTLTDAEVKEWLDSGISDIQVYAQDESTKQDYIRTYQGVIRMLSGIKPGESLEYMREIIHNDSDMLEDVIIANEDFDIESFQTNLDYDEE